MNYKLCKLVKLMSILKQTNNIAVVKSKKKNFDRFDYHIRMPKDYFN